MKWECVMIYNENKKLLFVSSRSKGREDTSEMAHWSTRGRYMDSGYIA